MYLFYDETKSPMPCNSVVIIVKALSFDEYKKKL